MTKKRPYTRFIANLPLTFQIAILKLRLTNTPPYRPGAIYLTSIDLIWMGDGDHYTAYCLVLFSIYTHTLSICLLYSSVCMLLSNKALLQITLASTMKFYLHLAPQNLLQPWTEPYVDDISIHEREK